MPNLQGRTPVGVGNGINYGEIAGEETHTLLSTEVPIHTHPLQAGTAASQAKPDAAILAGNGVSFFTQSGNLVAMNSAVLNQFGSSQPHENRQPYLVMNWCIAYTGIFPTRS